MRPAKSIALAGALVLVQSPVLADGGAEALGVMSVSLKDSIKPTFGFQGQTQGAGTPNEAGIGAFLPISVGDNSVFYLDALANANFGDMGYSSIVNTEVAGTTISTSSRLGYRWLNDARSWMFGINAGYDSRPMNTGCCKQACFTCPHKNPLQQQRRGGSDRNSVFFQQVAANLEAVSPTWNFNGYALVPVGTKEYRLNSWYDGGSLDTYGLDVGYFITPEINASVGYYYQQGDLGAADGSGVKAQLSFAVAKGVEFGGTYTYDNAFDSRASADLTIRFGGGSHMEKSKQQAKAEKQPQIKEISVAPSNRDVRVHDMASNTLSTMG